MNLVSPFCLEFHEIQLQSSQHQQQHQESYYLPHINQFSSSNRTKSVSSRNISGIKEQESWW